MEWTTLHGSLLGRACGPLLGRSEPGAMAFVRCLAPDVVAALAADATFAPEGWRVLRVADTEDPAGRTTDADTAVELRETKADATLLLVDTERAGAGMDGIYSAAREVGEAELFTAAGRIAGAAVTSELSSAHRAYAERAIRRAQGVGRHDSVSPWVEFDFLCRAAAHRRHPGEYLHLLGLWPVAAAAEGDAGAELAASRRFVDRLLGAAVTGLAVPARIASLRIAAAGAQRRDLERFLAEAATLPLRDALQALADQPHLWVGSLPVHGGDIRAIELTSWRNQNGRIAKWSGLVEPPEGAPELVLNPDAQSAREYSNLEVRWKARPADLENNAVDYRVALLTDLDEELAARDVRHSARQQEKCRFSNDDFSTLSEDALLSARVVVSVVGRDAIERQESEEFVIRFGDPQVPPAGGAGRKVRTFSEGLIEFPSRETAAAVAENPTCVTADARGFVVLRPPAARLHKSFRVFRPPLIRDVESDWTSRQGALGRWRVRVRASGERAAPVEFIPAEGGDGTAWGRTVAASRRLAEWFRAGGGGVGQVHDDRSRSFEVAKEYVLAWTALLDGGPPVLAICNTVEVLSLSGRMIGLIVLPAHPLRVAWLAAYDNLLLHAVFDQEQAPGQVQEELAGLDGAMFPAFLPNPAGGTFVFADTLGFHAVGMVPDADREPKAAVAVLARALGESEAAETAPTVGEQSAAVLGDEIVKYIECHESPRLLRMHALRAGDGLTIARALGRVHRHYGGAGDDTDNEAAEGADPEAAAPAFSLDLYPSPEQRAIAGRFIAEAREKRRSGAGVLAADDQWMLESISLPGGVALPRLRWARKESGDPKTAAHLAVAFDTFESQVEIDTGAAPTAPFRAFGLLSFFERDFAAVPTPSWRSVVPRSGGGEKHPSERGHTERLDRLGQKIVDAVARHVAEGDGEPTQRTGWRWPWAASNTTGDASQGSPVLRTTILPEKADSIRELHRLCDWVVTLDRNAGVEYFDSPRDNRDIYDAYVIDCVPEREDLGCLQLITSTSNVEEVHDLLDEALVRMGLSRTRRNAEFLLEHLKSLSGRLAIRLTGNVAPTSELIALAVAHANCRQAAGDDACWTPLDRGFLVPVDDVRDLLPPLRDNGNNGADGGGRQTRPDLLNVTTQPRRGLTFRFIEVKHRRHLRQSRAPDLLRQVQEQTVALRSRWQEWYGHESVYSAFRAVRRAKLARVLRFYADKAHRHGLSTERYQEVVAELDRMVERGADYAIQPAPDGDRGWVFCPEYAGPEPLEISPANWGARVFLFGPGRLPDADFRFGTDTAAERGGGRAPGAGASGEDERVEIPSSRSMSPAVDGGDRASVGAIPGAGEGGQGADGIGSSATTADPDTGNGVASRSNEGPAGGTTDPKGATKPSGGQTAPDRSAAPEVPTPVPAVALGADTLTGADVRWSLPIKGNPHLLIAGLPGMGKTTCLLNLCRQMVTAGVHPIVFSYHQDIDERLVDLVDSVRFVDFDGLGFNPLTVTNPESPRAYLDVAGSLRDIFAAIFPELGDLQCESIRRAIKESFSEVGSTGSETGAREPDFGRFVEILRAEPKPDRGLRTLLARLTELDDYGFFDIGEKRESLWSSDRPTIVRIHTTQNDALQRAFASLVFYGLYKDMFRRGIQERITHALIFDEAHRAAGLKLIPTMAKECRKYGISLVLASQEARDFDASLFSAVANYLVLRLTEADAKALVRNVATARQERTLIDKIKQMDRFRALYFCEGRQRPSSVSLHSLD